MARPDDLPTFATDTNFTNGPDVGTATKIAPSSGELAEGHIRNTAPSAQKQNWWQNNVGEWVGWVVDDVLGTVPMEAVVLDFTSDESFTTPSYVSPFAIVEGCGAGGPGGDGGDADPSASARSRGGGGGGGAPFCRQSITLLASTQYDVVIGSGVDSITEGFRGKPSTLVQQAGPTLASFPGGLGGVEGVDTGATAASTSSGGGPSTQTGVLIPLAPVAGPQCGGAGVTNNLAPQGGYSSPQGYAGGVSGATGANDGSYLGGGPGGGGGAGPYGAGATGGAGGAGDDTNAGNDGNPGSNAGANTGAGGGGGGGAGHGAGGDAGAAGAGTGGSGRVRVIYFRPITTP